MAPGSGSRRPAGTGSSREVELGRAWPHGLRGTRPLSSHHPVWTEIPQRGEAQGEGPALRRLPEQNRLGTELLGRLQIMGRGQRPELKAAWSPEAPGSVCPLPSGHRGAGAGSELACLPEALPWRQGPGLGQVAELLGGAGGRSRSSGLSRRRSGESSVPGEAVALQQAALRETPSLLRKAEAAARPSAIGGCGGLQAKGGRTSLLPSPLPCPAAPLTK